MRKLLTPRLGHPPGTFIEFGVFGISYIDCFGDTEVTNTPPTESLIQNTNQPAGAVEVYWELISFQLNGFDDCDQDAPDPYGVVPNIIPMASFTEPVEYFCP